MAKARRQRRQERKPGGRTVRAETAAEAATRRSHANRAADQYKDSLGPSAGNAPRQMDAYSNPQPFMPKYDDLIKQYYRTIAEQGRRKGE